MPRLLPMTPVKTYATRENAIKAVEKKYGAPQYDHLTYLIYTGEDGRFYPVFVGERALQAMVHFNFHVVA